MAHKKYKDRSRKNANDRETNSQKTENKNKFLKNFKKQKKQLKYCNDKYMKSKSNISRKYSYITLKKGSPIVMLFPLL